MKGEIKMEREVDKIRKDLAKHILSLGLTHDKEEKLKNLVKIQVGIAAKDATLRGFKHGMIFKYMTDSMNVESMLMEPNDGRTQRFWETSGDVLNYVNSLSLSNDARDEMLWHFVTYSEMEEIDAYNEGFCDGLHFDVKEAASAQKAADDEANKDDDVIGTYDVTDYFERR